MAAPERVYLSIGSNLGDRQSSIVAAADALHDEGHLVVRAASIWESAPWGRVNQPSFLNTVIEVETTLDPLSLVTCCQRIEARLGRPNERAPQDHWGPRTLDIDVLLYGERVIDDPRCLVPHPRMHMRAFVMLPLCELVPEYVHPVLGTRLHEIRDSLPTEETVSCEIRVTPDKWR